MPLQIPQISSTSSILYFHGLMVLCPKKVAAYVTPPPISYCPYHHCQALPVDLSVEEEQVFQVFCYPCLWKAAVEYFPFDHFYLL